MLFEYARERHGSDGLLIILHKMMERGYGGPKSSQDFKAARKYSLSHLELFLETYLATYGDADFDRMNREVAKKRGVVGFLVKWAKTPESLLMAAGEYWPNFCDYGKLEGKVENRHSGVLIGTDICPKPIFCRAFTSYFMGIMDNLRMKSVAVEHTKCSHKGASCDEWTISWKG